MGWRVEFRTMEIQLTPDENAAFSLFMHLLVRVLYRENRINLYLPITKVKENFARAIQRDALRQSKFHFRTNVQDSGLPIIEELSIEEILFGKADFRGIFHEI